MAAASSVAPAPPARGAGSGHTPDTTGTRGFLQTRLSLFAGLLALLFGLATTISLVVQKALALTSPSSPVAWWGAQFGVVSILVGVWLYCRFGRPSARVLAVLDAVAPIKMGLGTVAMIQGVPTMFRPELSVVLGMTHVLVARAALVPSTASRSAVIGTLASLPIVAGTYLAYRTDPHPILGSASAFALVTAVWLTLAVVSTTVASRVIYGLQREVRKAEKLGQYTLESKIGEGGMGVVYRASHAMLRRPTAVKLLSPARATQVDVSRFEREVQLTSRLTHANTVAIYDYGRTDDGVFYYAMEYLDGVDLEDLVALDGPQPPARVTHILAQLAGALAEAHAVGLIHRDIKPANVLLCERGGLHDVVKVVDFGLVKDLEQESAGVAVTQEGALTGTPLYLSPEAIASPRDVEARSDLYALGALGYFVLTGKPPFEGRTVVEVCSHHLLTTPVPPSVRLGKPVPPALEAAIMACLEKDKAKRPATATELRARLTRSDDARWTPADARAWWRDHGEAVRARRDNDPAALAATSMAVGASTTIAVDLMRRAALGE